MTWSNANIMASKTGIATYMKVTKKAFGWDRAQHTLFLQSMVHYTDMLDTGAELTSKPGINGCSMHSKRLGIGKCMEWLWSALQADDSILLLCGKPWIDIMVMALSDEDGEFPSLPNIPNLANLVKEAVLPSPEIAPATEGETKGKGKGLYTLDELRAVSDGTAVFTLRLVHVDREGNTSTIDRPMLLHTHPECHVDPHIIEAKARGLRNLVSASPRLCSSLPRLSNNRPRNTIRCDLKSLIDEMRRPARWHYFGKETISLENEVAIDVASRVQFTAKKLLQDYAANPGLFAKHKHMAENRIPTESCTTGDENLTWDEIPTDVRAAVEAKYATPSDEELELRGPPPTHPTMAKYYKDLLTPIEGRKKWRLIGYIAVCICWYDQWGRFHKREFLFALHAWC